MCDVCVRSVNLLSNVMMTDLRPGTIYLNNYLRAPELSIDNFRRQKHSCLHSTEGDTLAH